MTRTVSIVSLMTLAGALLATLAGCGAVDDSDGKITDPGNVATDDNSATDDAALTWRARHRRRAIAAPVTGTGTTSSGSGATTSSSPDPAAVAASAQNPDGAAIPQPAKANGECPDVLVAFGFWSCPTL